MCHKPLAVEMCVDVPWEMGQMSGGLAMAMVNSPGWESLLWRWWDEFSFPFRWKGILFAARYLWQERRRCMLECLHCCRLPTFLQRHKTLCSKSHWAKRVSEGNLKELLLHPKPRDVILKWRRCGNFVCANMRWFYFIFLHLNPDIITSSSGLQKSQKILKSVIHRD